MFGIVVMVCSQCSGVLRVLVAIHDPGAIAQVLLAMGLASSAPKQSGSRAPLAEGGVGSTDEGLMASRRERYLHAEPILIVVVFALIPGARDAPLAPRPPVLHR